MLLEIITIRVLILFFGRGDCRFVVEPLLVVVGVGDLLMLSLGLGEGLELANHLALRLRVFEQLLLLLEPLLSRLRSVLRNHRGLAVQLSSII